MTVFLYCGVISWILFAVNILLLVLYGTDSVYMDYAFLLGMSVYTFTPLAVIAFTERRKQKKIMNALKKHSAIVEAKICSYKYTLILSRYNRFHHKFDVEFEYEGRRASYTVQTNNRKAAEYKDAETLPICYLPAYCEYCIGRLTEKEFFKELGCKVKLGDQDTFMMIIFADDLKKRNLPIY